MNNNYLEHYGVVGMKWGRRRSTPRITTSGQRPRLTGPEPEIIGEGRSRQGFRSDNSKAKNTKYRDVGGSNNSGGSSKSNNSGGSSKSNNSGGTNNSGGSKKTKFTSNNDSYQAPNKPQAQKRESGGLDLKSTRQGVSDGKKLVDAGSKYMKDERKKRDTKNLKAEAKDMSDDDLRNIINRLSMEEKYVQVMEKQGFGESKSNLETTLETIGTIAGYADTALSIYEKIQGVRGR